MPASTVAAPSAAALARAFVRCVVDGDPALGDLLAEDVWLRCLLPRELVEHHDRAGTLATISGWFGQASQVDVEETFHRTVEGREHVGWRLRLLPDWQPDTWHRIEQVGYVRVTDGRVRRIDLVCTGFHPLTDPVDEPRTRGLQQRRRILSM